MPHITSSNLLVSHGAELHTPPPSPRPPFPLAGPPPPPSPPAPRPDYKELALFKRRWPSMPLLALTATATPRVQVGWVWAWGWGWGWGLGGTQSLGGRGPERQGWHIEKQVLKQVSSEANAVARCVGLARAARTDRA